MFQIWLSNFISSAISLFCFGIKVLLLKLYSLHSLGRNYSHHKIIQPVFYSFRTSVCRMPTSVFCWKCSWVLRSTSSAPMNWNMPGKSSLPFSRNSRKRKSNLCNTNLEGGPFDNFVLINREKKKVFKSSLSIEHFGKFDFESFGIGIARLNLKFFVIPHSQIETFSRSESEFRTRKRSSSSLL